MDSDLRFTDIANLFVAHRRPPSLVVYENGSTVLWTIRHTNTEARPFPGEIATTTVITYKK
jgi:hypothetical protein